MCVCVCVCVWVGEWGGGRIDNNYGVQCIIVILGTQVLYM